MNFGLVSQGIYNDAAKQDSYVLVNSTVSFDFRGGSDVRYFWLRILLHSGKKFNPPRREQLREQKKNRIIVIF